VRGRPAHGSAGVRSYAYDPETRRNSGAGASG
jgi:hypothetical protein